MIIYGEWCRICNLRRFSFGTRDQARSFKRFCVAKKGQGKLLTHTSEGGWSVPPLLVLSRPYILLPDPLPQQTSEINKNRTVERSYQTHSYKIHLKITRSVKRFLLRRNMSLSKIRCYCVSWQSPAGKKKFVLFSSLRALDSYLRLSSLMTMLQDVKTLSHFAKEETETQVKCCA